MLVDIAIPVEVCRRGAFRADGYWVVHLAIQSHLSAVVYHSIASKRLALVRMTTLSLGALIAFSALPKTTSDSPAEYLSGQRVQ